MFSIRRFSQLGLTARRCCNEPDVRVKPVQIDGGPDSPYSVTLFVEDGNILGVGVNDTEAFILAANVGETWDNVGPMDFATLGFGAPGPTKDALTGEEFGSGWTVTRRYDGETRDFRSLTTILRALQEGTFGLKLYPDGSFVDDDVPDEPSWAGTCIDCDDPAACADLRADEDLGPVCPDRANAAPAFVGDDDHADYGPVCPERTCNGCPAPILCAELRTAETSCNRARNGEPLGWNAPELS